MTPYGFDEGDVGVMSDIAKKTEESGKRCISYNQNEVKMQKQAE